MDALEFEAQVQKEINRLKNATEWELHRLCEVTAQKRVAWFLAEQPSFDFISNDLLYSAYRLLLARFGISEHEAPVFERNEAKIVFHSANPCPTLEACKRLSLDTRYICRHYNEEATDRLVKQLSPRLAFQRNYAHLRPDCAWCEEVIFLRDE